MTLRRMLRYFTRCAQFAQHIGWGWCLLAVFLASVAPAGHGQDLNWEGQTGAFVTPFAYTSPSPAGGFGLPAVAFSLSQRRRRCSEVSTKSRALLAS